MRKSHRPSIYVERNHTSQHQVTLLAVQSQNVNVCHEPDLA